MLIECSYLISSPPVQHPSIPSWSVHAYDQITETSCILASLEGKYVNVNLQKVISLEKAMPNYLLKTVSYSFKRSNKGNFLA